MKRGRLSSSKSTIHEEGEEDPTNQLSGEVKLGDLIWVRHCGSSWWPSQVSEMPWLHIELKVVNFIFGMTGLHLFKVAISNNVFDIGKVVDANTVSESIKPSNRSVGEVLVRLYGSYEYLFVDPMKSRSEFEHVLKQNNGSYRGVFLKSLERDRPHFNSSGSIRKGSRSKVKVEVKNKLSSSSHSFGEEMKSKTLEQNKDDLLKKLKPSSMTPTSAATSSGISQELSGRRVKVMQSLGLVAPAGSPFRRIYPFCD